jgi:excisionase family DNA binding protein
MTGPRKGTSRRERIITAYCGALEEWGGGDLASLYAAVQEPCPDIGLCPARAPRERKPDPQGLLTFARTAARLGVSERTLRKLVDDGELAYIDVGGGRERRSMRFTPQDIEAFLAKRRGTAWRSTSEAKPTTTSSSFEVLDFAALRAARASEKRKSSSAPSGKRRRRKPNVVKLSDGGR